MCWIWLLAYGLLCQIVDKDHEIKRSTYFFFMCHRLLGPTICSSAVSVKMRHKV